MLLWREQQRSFPVSEIAARLYVGARVAKALRSIGIAVWQVDGTLWSPEQRSLL